MRSLSVFFKQVRFVEDGKYGLSRHFGEFVIVLKRLMVSGDGRAELNAETAGAWQPAPHHLAAHDRGPLLGGVPDCGRDRPKPS